jgi:hypothetical protein
MAAQPDLRGFSLAGIKLAIVPGALLLGPVFQDISVQRKPEVVQTGTRKAEAKEQADMMMKFGLTWDGQTNTLKHDGKSETTNIALLNGLNWKSDNSIVFAS